MYSAGQLQPSPKASGPLWIPSCGTVAMGTVLLLFWGEQHARQPHRDSLSVQTSVACFDWWVGVV